MRQRKTLQDLTLKDNFLFAAVMMDMENCRQFLEMTLGLPIERVEVSREKSIVYHPEYKGIRLDIYAKDEKQTRYNVEMQAFRKPQIPKRVRYYHSQMDMELLLEGMAYPELPDSYVIFLCDFDPFGEKKYRYTFENRCRETGNTMEDGSCSIFLSTQGKNEEEVPKELVTFLQYVKAGRSISAAGHEDDFVSRIEESIRKIKENREMEERYMVLEEMLKEERAEGKAEGRAEGRAEAILELLKELGPVSEELRSEVFSERDLQRLQVLLRAAARSASIEDFLRQADLESK